MIIFQRGNVTVREARYSDLELWRKNQMRALEVLEVWASDHMKPVEAVERSMTDSLESYTILYGDELVGMFGIAPESLLDNKASVWLLTTDKIHLMRTTFLRCSKAVIAHLRHPYPLLYNFVDARNEQCIRWLKWAGAEIYPPEAHGLENLPFHYFTFGGA